MNKKYLATLIFILLMVIRVYSQNNIVKELYYVDGDIGSCGVIMRSGILLFVSDTLHPEETEYSIAVLCVNEDSLKKNIKYKVRLNKYDKIIKKHFPLFVYKEFIKMPNHYYCEDADINIKKIE